MQEPRAGQAWGTLAAAARMGETASIGHGFWTPAHGGAIESLLDEATAELVMMEWAPLVVTIEVRHNTLDPRTVVPAVRRWKCALIWQPFRCAIKPKTSCIKVSHKSCAHRLGTGEARLR